MKNLKMMSTLLALTLVCLLSSFKAADYDVTTCGTIGTEGDIMRIETEDSTNAIEGIVLTNASGTTHSINGCGANICTYSIRTLPAGTYQVNVVTAFCVFSETIVKK